MERKCFFEKNIVVAPLFCAWARLESIANRHIFGHVGLSSSGFKILAFLAQKKKATPGEIVIELNITKSNLSQRLRALETKHFVKHTHAGKESDQRKIYFLITAAGKKKLHEAALLSKQTGLSFEKEFTKEEIRHHEAFFSKLISLLDKKEQELETLNQKAILKK